MIRLLPDGNRDVTFGDAGEVRSTFGLPRPKEPDGATYASASAITTSIVVDARDRPIVGGGYAASYQGCQTFAAPDPFVTRLTAGSAVDTTFGGKGFSLLGGNGEVSALALTPEGGPATLSYGVSCGSRSENQPSRFTALTEAGRPAPSLDAHRPKFFMERAMAIDPQGRVLVIQIPPPAAEGPASLARLLPNGRVDPRFAKKGRLVLKGGLTESDAFTVDAEGRPILAGYGHGIELRRLTAAGAPDPGFGPGGRLFAKGGFVQAVALDGQGRIYTAGVVKHKSQKTGYGVQVTRFLPSS